MTIKIFVLYRVNVNNVIIWLTNIPAFWEGYRTRWTLVYCRDTLYSLYIMTKLSCTYIIRKIFKLFKKNLLIFQHSITVWVFSLPFNNFFRYIWYKMRFIEMWNQIDQNPIRRLILSMQRNCQEILRASSVNIRY